MGYAVLESQSRSIAERIWDPAFTADRDPMDRIFKLLDNVEAVYRERKCVGGCPIGSLAMEMNDIHEGFWKKTEEVSLSWVGKIRGALEEGVGSGQLKEDVHVDEVADFILASIQDAGVLCVTSKDLNVILHCFRNLKTYLKSLIN